MSILELELELALVPELLDSALNCVRYAVERSKPTEPTSRAPDDDNAQTHERSPVAQQVRRLRAQFLTLASDFFLLRLTFQSRVDKRPARDSREEELHQLQANSASACCWRARAAVRGAPQLTRRAKRSQEAVASSD